MGSPIDPNESSESPTVLLRRLHHWRMAFFGMVILLAGMLSGAAVTLLVVGQMGRKSPPHPAVPMITQMLARLSGPLHLTVEQEKQIEPILQTHMARLIQIQEEGQKTIGEELRLLSQEMAGVLTGDQMRLWERLFLDLPVSIRHIPQGYGPGTGRGPAPPGGWRGRPNGRGPLHSPSHTVVPGPNAVPHN